MFRTYIIAIFTTTISTFFLNGQEKLEIAGFISAFKSQDYEKAITLANQFSDSEAQLQFAQLANINYWAGQKGLTFFSYTGNKDMLRLINLLSQGYYQLYSDPYNWSSFERFSEAYELAGLMNDTELEKLVLLGIIKVYNSEFYQSSEESEVYLARLKLLRNSKVDDFYIKSNELIFQLKNVFYEFKLPDDFIKDFDVLMEDFDEDHVFQPIYHSLKGVYHEVMKRDTIAKEFHESAIQLVGKRPFLKYISFRSLIHLSEIMKRQKRFEQGLVYLKEAANFKNLSDTLRSSYYLNYYAAPHYAGIGNSYKAYQLMRASNDLERQLDHKKNALEISKLNTKFQTAQKEKQIIVEQQRATKNRNWLIAAGITLLLGAGIAILLQKNTIKKRQLAEQEALLKQERVDNLLKEQELVSIDAMIAGQEKERKKVAGELHDDLGSLMATIKLHFSSVEAKHQSPSLLHAKKLLEEAYQKVRGIAHNKNSGVMSDLGLIPAIKKMAHTITDSGTLNVAVEDFGLGNRMENSLELSVFRMVQELVANTIKHANASQLTIQLTQHEDNLNIIIEDNGKGFDPSKVNFGRKGMGLTAIEKRVEHLEGSFTIDSILGKGTSILIDIPV